MAEVYCFNLPAEIRGYILALSARYRIRMVEVGEEKFSLTLKEIAAGFPGKGAGKAFEEPLLLMDHFDQQQFNGFLDDLRMCAPAFSGFKAVVTPSNRHWTANALVEELRLEKEAVEKQRKAAQKKDET